MRGDKLVTLLDEVVKEWHREPDHVVERVVAVVVDFAEEDSTVKGTLLRHATARTAVALRTTHSVHGARLFIKGVVIAFEFVVVRPLTQLQLAAVTAAATDMPIAAPAPAPPARLRI